MNPPTSAPIATDDPVAEIHEIRRRIAAEHGTVRMQKQLVPAAE
jgi:hypothetical protein